MDLSTALMHEVGHRPGREHQGAGVPTETVGAGTWRGPGADADLARMAKVAGTAPPDTDSPRAWAACAV
jgi:hypothetical protein